MEQQLELIHCVQHHNETAQNIINKNAVDTSPKLSCKERIKIFLLMKGKATNAEIAELVRGTKGQLSWGQRLRDIRKDLQKKGKNLVCKEVRTGIYLYSIIEG